MEAGEQLCWRRTKRDPPVNERCVPVLSRALLVISAHSVPVPAVPQRTFSVMHLHPAFLSAFVAATEQAKTAMVEKLMADWLHAGPSPINHCGALVELLHSAGQSAARRCLIEQLVTTRLVSTLCQPSTMQKVAAQCSASLLEAYPPASSLFCESLAHILQSSARPECLHDGLLCLAEASPCARRDIFPALLSVVQMGVMSGHPTAGSHSFESVARGSADIALLRGCLAQSPYQDALGIAFPRG